MPDMHGSLIDLSGNAPLTIVIFIVAFIVSVLYSSATMNEKLREHPNISAAHIAFLAFRPVVFTLGCVYALILFPFWGFVTRIMGLVGGF